MPYSHASVDEQVVKMSFDNSNFDSNVNDSIKTLNNLDGKLGSLNKDNFDGLTRNWGNVADFFTVKGQVMFGILTRIGGEVVNLGIKFKNYLFKGIKDGIGEYETIINSTQTIYQNVKQSGASIGDVNAALDELNDYADKTIYNFGQMTNMIGRFTSAGVGLNKSVSTIKGLANAAALVGATPEKAEQAWLAVSKAMSSGTFSAYTWKSLELSNIAGEQFKNVITEVARANNATGKSGKNIDQLLEKYGDIKSSLQEGWLTKDIFNEAMQIMSGAMDDEALKAKGYSDAQIKQLRAIAESAEEAATKVKTFRQLMDTLGEAVGSGWAQSFRILVGDLEQAKDLYTRISNVIGNFIDNNAKIRNELFKQIMGDSENESLFKGLKTGRESFKQTIENIMATVKTFLKAVKTGFLNIFPIERISTAARKVMDVIQNFTRAFVLNSEEAKQKVEGLTGWDTSTIDKISESVKDLIRFFRGLASAIDIAWMAISQPIKAIVKRIPFLNNFFENLGSNIKGLVGNLGKFGDKITVIRNAFRNTNAIEEIVGYFLDNIDELGKKYPILGSILWVFNSIKTVLISIKDVFKSMNIRPLAIVFGTIKFIAEAIWRIINFIFGVLKSIKDNIDWSFLEGPKKAVIDFLKKIGDYGQGLISFEDLVGKIGEKLKNIFSKLFNIFDKSNKASDKVVNSANKVQKAAGKTGSVLSTIWEKIKAFFGSIGSFFGKIFEGADFSFEGIVKKIAALGGGVLAAGLGISHLAKTIGKVRVLNNLNNLLNAGTKVLVAYQKQIQSKTILNIAIAIGILAAAMVGLAFIPYEKLENGLVIFSSFMAVLAMTLTPIITALSKFNDSFARVRESANKFTVIETLIKRFKSVFTKLARALEFRMLGKMFKDIAVSILILVGALTALVFLFKYEQDNLLKSAALVAGMIGVITVSVFSLVLVIELLSKRTENLKASVGTFSSFFKLAGISRVIISIAAAVLILAGAMAIMTKLDQTRLQEAFWMIFGLVAAMGVIAMVIAGLTSLAEDTGKLKKIKVSMLGAMAGIAIVLLAMKPLIEALSSDRHGAWIKAIVIFTVIITQFTAMAIVLFDLAKSMHGMSTWYLKRFTQTLGLMTITLGAMAGILYIIGNMGDIPKSVITVLTILTVAFLGIISVISLVSIVMSRVQSTFSGNFANVILSISVAISSVITSIGLFAAGIGVLVYALSNMNVPETNVDEKFTNILDRLEKVADTLNRAVPKLREMFYNIGFSIGRVFVSFIYGIASGIATTGEELLAIADKFVNIIIDLLDKIVNILYSRKEDIARIIKRAIEFIILEITTILNGFFKKKNGKGLFSENFVSKIIGVGGIVYAINKITKAAGGILSVIKKIKALSIVSDITRIWRESTRLSEAITGINSRLVHGVGNLKLFKGIGQTVQKASGGKLVYDNESDIDPADTIGAIVALTAAIKLLTGAVHAFKLLTGKAQYTINRELQNGWDVIKEALSDSETQNTVLAFGIYNLANLLSRVFKAGWALAKNYVFAPLKAMLAVLKTIVFIIPAALTVAVHSVVSAFDKIFKTDYANDFANSDWFNFISDNTSRIGDNYKGIWDGLKNGWDESQIHIKEAHDHLFDTIGEEATGDGYEIGSNLVAGEVAGVNDNIITLNETLSKTTQEGVDIVKKILGEHSPSKTFEEIYKDVMYGSVNGLKAGEENFYSYFKHVTNTIKGIADEDAVAISQAWSDIIYAAGYEEAKKIAKELGNTAEYFAILQEQYGLSPGDSIRKIDGLIGRFHSKKDGSDTGVLEKEVELNQQLLNLVIKRANTIEGINEGLDKANLKSEILNMAEQAGVKTTEEEVVNLLGVLEYASDKTDMFAKYVLADFEKLDEYTTASVVEAIGKQRAASDLALVDIATNYENMGQIAEDHKEELIGLKQEEVQEKLKAEALAAGMSEQAAEDSSRMITASLFAGITDRTELLESEFNYRIGLYKGDLKNYHTYQSKLTFLEQEAVRIRATIAANAANQAYEEVTEMASKGASADEIWRHIKDNSTAGDREMNSWYQGQLNGILAEIDQLSADAWGGMYTAAERAGIEDAEAWANGYVDQAMNLLGKQQTNKRGGIIDIISNLWSSFGASAPEIDTKWWDYNEKAKESATLTDSDINTAVGAASDLKDGLESQRADLTPTFDLDQLASDAQKANGIVMSSLMAAQNASIGDYINQDSELNPFMKDRWQNVYNFTQNNYSPKALSRIDIYRQTQRQLGMSRGF